MKKVFLTILGLCMTAVLCAAQTRQIDFIQRGSATQEMQVDTLTAAHPSLPIGSRARITNPVNNAEIEVTITERIPASADRVIDLSPDAMAALALEAGGAVIVTLPHQPAPSVENYTPPEPLAAAEPQPEPELPNIPAVEPLFNTPPVTDIKIIPALPNPNNGKTYRLLVGAYQGLELAFRVTKQLESTGFQVVQEQAGDMCLVYAAGIPSARLYFAAQRLGSAGFQQVWVLE